MTPTRTDRDVTMAAILPPWQPTTMMERVSINEPTTDRQRVVVLGRIPDGPVDLLRAAHDVWAWDRDETLPTDLRRSVLAYHALRDLAVYLVHDVRRRRTPLGGRRSLGLIGAVVRISLSYPKHPRHPRR